MATLVTGITGFIGSEYFKLICEDTSHDYYLLIRPNKEEQWSEMVSSCSHVHVIVGDILAPDIFRNEKIVKEMKRPISRIVHLAALYDLSAKYDELYKANVVGTQNLLFYAKHSKTVKEVFYASTIAVAGDWQGLYTEDDFDLGQSFQDFYAKTKYEAEKLVRSFASENPDIQINIARFGIVVGHSETGYMPRVDGPYFILQKLALLQRASKQLERLPFLYFPYEEASEIPMVPVDFAAQVINGLEKPKKENSQLRVIHVICDQCPTNKEFMHDFLGLMGIHLEVKSMRTPKIVNPMLRLGLKALSMPESLSDYMNSTLRISSHQLKLNLKKSIEIPQYKDFSDTILKYSLEHFN